MNLSSRALGSESDCWSALSIVGSVLRTHLPFREEDVGGVISLAGC
jgi:hypothetical protein